MYIQVKKISFVADTYGQHIKINMVGLYEDNGKFVKWIKLDEKVLSAFQNVKIKFDYEKSI
jgi:hypothetical protein